MHAGPAYENEIVEKFNCMAIFPALGRTAELNKALDKDKLDIMPIEAELFEEFIYKIQAKNTTKAVPYSILLEQMEKLGGTPVILHKKTKKVSEDRYLTEGRYAIMKEEDFLKLAKEHQQFKEGYNELMQYWDSIADDQQIELHKRLTKLGL